MKNKKGFTLIEVIIVIAIIGVLLIIIIPTITRYVKKGKEEYNLDVKKSLVQIAKDYYSDNKKLLPLGQQLESGGYRYITSVDLSTLKSNNYVNNSVTDAEKNSCDSSYVVVENVSGGFEYHACMKCGDTNYSTDDSYCKFENSSIGTPPTCNVEYQNYDPNTWSSTDVNINIIGTDDEGIIFYKVNDKIISGIANENKEYVGNYKITDTGNNDYAVYAYDKDNNRVLCEPNNITTKIDKDNPLCESVKRVNIDNSTANIEIIASDKLSGVNSIKIGNNVLETNISSQKTIGNYTTKANGTYIAEITDNAGRKTLCEPVTILDLDGEKPIINYSVTGGKNKATISTTITDNVGVVAYQITDSQVEPTTWVGISSTKEFKQNFEKTEAKSYFIYAKDVAGNISYKELKLKFITDSSCDCASWGSESYSYACTEYVNSTCPTTYPCTQYRTVSESYSCQKSTTCQTCTTKTSYYCCSCGSSATGGTGSGGPTSGCGCYCTNHYPSCTSYTCYYSSTCTRSVQEAYTGTCSGTTSCTVPVSSTCTGATSVCNRRAACKLVIDE